MIRISVRKTVPILAAIALAFAPSGAGAHQLRHAPKHKAGAGTSTNWSGYAVDGANATSVTASWIQPYATNCSAVPKSWSSPWVGIDGDNSSTVEQIGTDSDCSGGTPTYYAWWEMYPKSAVVISSITVHPGDALTATVSYGSAGFTLTLADTTTGKYFSITQAATNVARSSVEWVMEGPSNANLTNFGTVSFTNASAVIGGQTVSPNSAGANPITMVTKKGALRAVPTLTGPGSFAVSWQHS